MGWNLDDIKGSLLGSIATVEAFLSHFWPKISLGRWWPHISIPRPQFAYSLQNFLAYSLHNFYVAKMTIKGSLLHRIVIENKTVNNLFQQESENYWYEPIRRIAPERLDVTARRRPTYSVKLRRWKISTFYFKIVTIPTPLTITITPRRQTRRCLLISLRTSMTLWPSTLWNRSLFSSFRTMWKRLHVYDDVRQ